MAGISQDNLHMPGKCKIGLHFVAIYCHGRKNPVTYLWPLYFNNVSRLSFL